MVALRIRFLTGRYHATPWGQHVNEGLVEWPPSPWRLVRALVAVGFKRLGWAEGDLPDAVARLVSGLAAGYPEFVLPPALASHTRHYMPIGAKTTQVLDTFAHVGSGELWVRWNVDLDAESVELLGKLAVELPYLGRAESWTECAVLEDLPDGVSPNGVPASEAGPGEELVELLAPASEARWTEIRGALLDGLCEGLSRGKRGGVERLLPVRLVESLLVTTSDLQKVGLRRPPSAAGVMYRVPERALSMSGVRRGRLAHLPESRPEFAVFAVTGDSQRGTLRPRVGRTLPFAELLHAALAKAADGSECPELTGRGPAGELLEGHRHVHLAALDLDGDRRIDHVLAWAPMGFGPAAARALATVQFVFDAERGRWAYLTLAGLGCRAAARDVLGAAASTPVGSGAVWRSTTPFVAPRYLKRGGRNDLEGQLRAELSSRGLPGLQAIRVGERLELSRAGFFDYVRRRRRGRPSPPSTRPWLLTLTFEQEIEGPVSLGYASHFGLGQFEPVA